MKNLKRMLSILITLKRMASVFLLLALLIVGLSAQERHQGSPRRPRARTSRPDVDIPRLAGTYRLNTARSDNASAAVYGATNSLPEEDQLLILGGLMSRLESPDVLVIERREQAVTISPSNAPGVIVRHLVELHGGTVEADSPGEGQGATFVVKLPIVPLSQKETLTGRVQPATGDAPPAYDCPERLDELRVLVVDDEVDTRELLKAGIGRCGAEVVTAGSPREALATLEEMRPDLLISDIGMPGEDGYELIRKVRALPAGRGQFVRLVL